MSELISVIMSVYNESAAEFTDALDSIRSQTHRELEIIVVVDDPARKDIVELLQSIPDDRLRYHVNAKNLGLAASMNLAARLARGDYLARMDADDISFPERLEKELCLLQSKRADYVCAWYRLMDEQGRPMEKGEKKVDGALVNELLPYCVTICHPTVLIRKDVFEAVGGYRGFPCAQDYDLWLRLYDQGYRAAVVQEILLSYRIRKNSTTSQKSLQQFYTAEYIRSLSRERRRQGTDRYSPENYQSFLRQNGVFDPRKLRRWEACRAGKAEKGRWYYLVLLFRSETHRKIIRNILLCKWAEWRILHKRPSTAGS